MKIPIVHINGGEITTGAYDELARHSITKISSYHFVSSKKNKDEFHNIIKKISQKIFIPLTVGGGINNLNDVEKYLKNGADKILLNNLFFKNRKLFNEISRIFGRKKYLLDG